MTAILERPAPRRAERRRPLDAPAGVEQFIAVVTRADDSGLEVRAGLSRWPAKRALSCLLEVATGDVVLCAGPDRDAAWILHVLERKEPIAGRVVCPAGTTLESADGRLRLKSDALEIESDRVRVASRETVLTGDSAELHAQQVEVIAGCVKVVGNTLRSVFERISQFSTTYLRNTEGLDRVQAKHLEMRASGLARVSAEHTLFEGEKLVKTRGAQIHFG